MGVIATALRVRVRGERHTPQITLPTGRRSFPNNKKDAATRTCRRAFSSAKETDDEEKNEQTTTLKLLQNQSLKGVGQVIFLNSKKSGAILLGSLAIGDPYLAYLAATGTVAANITANSVLGLDRTALNNGLWAYNGCLVGCATAVFLAPLLEGGGSAAALTLLQGTLITAPLAAGSAVVAAALPGACGSVPQWTWAFNIVTLTQLLRTQPFFVAQSNNNADACVEPEIATEAVTTAISISDLVVAAPLRGLSQIFVVESALSGLGVTAAIASYSPALALHALMGSAVGSLTGLVCTGGAAAGDVAAGLWGFNSALTSLGIAVFMVYSSPSTSGDDASNNKKKQIMKKNNDTALLFVSAGGAVASACTFGALQKVFGMAWGAPCLTLPFCITMSGCYLLAGRIPGLELAESPHSPEQNQPPTSP